MNEEDQLELYIDSEDTYLELDNVFYINPHRLSLTKCLSNNQFISCVIKNSPVECLTSMNFSHILKKLKPNSTCEVIIYQPISVMQDYDAKQVEANARLAGFTDFQTEKRDFVDTKTDKKFRTMVISFIKPVKNPNQIEVEVTVKDKSGRNQGTSSKKTAPSVNTGTRTKYAQGKR